MKLAAIYNVWDGVEHLRGSMDCLKDHVDLFIIVWQNISNFGEEYDPCPEMNLPDVNYLLVKYTPELSIGGRHNETAKRNMGIGAARAAQCSHFLHMDCDEYYEDFGKAKQLYVQSGAEGSICEILTYFKTPTLRFENPDNYFVPFIHVLKPDAKAGVSTYPFYVDPTRRINVTGVAKLPVYMHHFSYIRKNIYRKVQNSSAKKNIEKSNLLADYLNPDTCEGSFIKDFGQKLISVDNIFGIRF